MGMGIGIGTTYITGTYPRPSRSLKASHQPPA
jgi:hypothetical protein